MGKDVEKKRKGALRSFALLTLFGVPMGFMEAAVVVYLRAIFYPAGFRFPMAAIFDSGILAVECCREISTLIMLLAIGWIAGRNFIQRFSYFLYSFALWDIFYYIFLKATLGWPESLLTWDILFLIPITWVSPILAPLIVSVTFIVIALLLVLLNERRGLMRIPFVGWFCFVSGCLIVLVTFMWDLASIVIGGGFLSRYATLAADPGFLGIVSEYVPSYFNWPLFALGEVLMLALVIIAFLGALSFTSSEKRRR